MRQPLSATTYAVQDMPEAIELYHARGWTDGLPIVPPTEDAVAACLEWAGLPADFAVGVEPVRERPLTAEKIAINGVMAGCLPAHFPVVTAAVHAMCDPSFLLHGATASTGGCAVLVIVNGPIRAELGMGSGIDVLGTGDRASASIGRALRLVLINLLGTRPGDLDRSTLGHPGKMSFCVAEDEANLAPWRPLAQERGVPGDASAVTVVAAGAPRQIMNEWTTSPEELLETVAAEMRANMLHYSIWAGDYTLIVPPQLRTRLVDAAWSKDDVRAFLHDRARVRRREWEAVGKANVVAPSNADREYTALPTADDLMIVGAGGPAGGFAAVIAPWFGTKSRAVTAAIGSCHDC